MLPRLSINIVRTLVLNSARMLSHPHNYLLCDLSSQNNAKLYNIQSCKLYVVKRFKSTKKFRKEATEIRKDSDDEDSDKERENDEEQAPVGSKISKVKLSSIRLDAISKKAFGISRNKIEEIFYASKFRINGGKVLKKSKEVEIGDEIDIILHQKENNPKLLIVNRIVILSMEPASDGVIIKLSKDKNLLIENYEDPYVE